MTIKEKEILDYVKECITNCLRKNVKLVLYLSSLQ